MGKKNRPSVFAVIHNNAGQILFVRRNENDQYGLPGGRIKKDESERDALSREINEETLLNINPSEPALIDEIDIPIATESGEQSTRKIFIFLAKATQDPAPNAEIGEVRWISQSDLRNKEILEQMNPDIARLIEAYRARIEEKMREGNMGMKRL